MPDPFRYCLNTATIRRHELGIVKEVDLAAKAGYGAIEPWIDTIRDYQQAGGSLKDLRKRIRDAGLKVPGAIGFAGWLVDGKRARAKQLEQAKADMDLVRQIGGTGIAAPPFGMIEKKNLNPLVAAERYRALLELGDEMGIVPQLEVWGFSTAICRLSEATKIAMETAHPKACLLLDVYHLYKGGSDFHGLKLLHGRAVPMFHMNDYPADPPRETIVDADRVWPGDGVAPMGQVLRDLKAVGFRGWLSLELFNPTYDKRPARTVARTGLRKMKSAVAKALK